MKDPGFIILKQWYFFIRNSDHKYFYRLYGLRRSGNHALLNWILVQVPGMSCLNNNMGAFHPPERTPIKRMAVHGFSRRNLLVSHEDKPLTAEITGYNEDKFGPSRKKFNILLLRDPYNWMASQYAWKDRLGNKFRKDSEYRLRLIELWKEYACTYMKWENGPAEAEELQIPVNYNEWVNSREYRLALAGKLDIPFTDKGRNNVAGHGNGSSFSGRNLHGRGSELKVLSRWHRYRNDPTFRNLFDDEMLKLAQEIFALEIPKGWR